MVARTRGAPCISSERGDRTIDEKNRPAAVGRNARTSEKREPFNRCHVPHSIKPPEEGGHEVPRVLARTVCLRRTLQKMRSANRGEQIRSRSNERYGVGDKRNC